MRKKLFWEVTHLDNKVMGRYSLDSLIKKIEPYKREIWELNSNIYNVNLVLYIKKNTLYNIKFPSLTISNISNFEHIIIDIVGNCYLGNNYVNCTKLNSTFTNKEKIEKKVKEILKCSGK